MPFEQVGGPSGHSQLQFSECVYKVYDTNLKVSVQTTTTAYIEKCEEKDKRIVNMYTRKNINC